MEKVYIVFSDELSSDGNNVMGVYRTKEDAEKAKLYFTAHSSVRYFSVQSFNVMNYNVFEEDE